MEYWVYGNMTARQQPYALVLTGCADFISRDSEDVLCLSLTFSCSPHLVRHLVRFVRAYPACRKSKTSGAEHLSYVYEHLSRQLLLTGSEFS